MERRVVITGMGALTPLGLSVPAFWGGLKEGRSGIDRVTRFDATGFESMIGGELKGFTPEPYIGAKEARRMDHFIQYGVVASEEAAALAQLRNSGIDGDRMGVIWGSGIGGIETLTSNHEALITRGPRRVSPFCVPMMIPNMAAGVIAIRLGARGPNLATVSACASATHAIGESFRLIQDGAADVMITGGSEAPICPFAYAGFCNMKALSTRNESPQIASRPFDAGRDGFIMAEGAGAVILEELEHALKRGVQPLGEIVGYGASADAFHITAPSPDGNGAARAMTAALNEAGLRPVDVDYINAHGTSTQLNDKMETAAIHTVFGDHARALLVSSTKSMVGHLLGAAGAVELIATTLALAEGWVHPTMNHTEPDLQCDLDYVPNHGRAADIRIALSNSFGFGGHNVSLAVKRYE